MTEQPPGTFVVPRDRAALGRSPAGRRGVRSVGELAAALMAIAAAAAMLLPSAAIAEAERSVAPASATAARIYNVTVTAQTKTTWIDGGCAPYCVPYRGTVEWTQEYRGLRIASSKYPGYARLEGRRIGTTTARWDHANEPYCVETLTERLKAELYVNALYYRRAADTAKGMRLKPSVLVTAHMRGPAEGVTHTCATQARVVPVVGRLGTSLVSGSLSEAGVGLSDFRIVRRTNGAPGAPLDQLSRGVGFVITLAGSTKDLASTRQDLANGKQATYTEGTVRIVFTPVARNAQAAVTTRLRRSAP